MRVTRRIICCFILLYLPHATAFANDFAVLAGPMPPYTVCKGLRVEGVAVSVLSEIMKMTDTPFDPKRIKLLPWAQAIQIAETKSRKILLNVPRTPDIEKKFKWVGPMDTQRFVLVGKKGTAFAIASSTDSKNYKTATIRNSDPEKKLLSKGIDAEGLHQNTTHVQALRGLDARSVDLLAHSDMATAFLMTGLGIDTKEYTVVYTYFEESLYYAFSKDTDDALITKLNLTLSKLKIRSAGQASRFDEIVAEYLPNGRLK